MPEKKQPSPSRKRPTRKAAREPAGDPVRVLVEIRQPRDQPAAAAMASATSLGVPGFQVDDTYEPVPVSAPADQGAVFESARESIVLVRGTVSDEGEIEKLKQQDNVVNVWLDTPIAPFSDAGYGEEGEIVQPLAPTAGACAIPPCDCDPRVPKGAIANVAAYLGVDQIWAEGHRGQGVVIGIVDGGITAQGRPISAADTGHPQWPNKLIPRVVGGWPTASWGTTGAAWSWHGNMTATDALGMAPEAQIYDIRISDGNAISQALAGFQWALSQFKAGKGPHVLSNSWGIFQEVWDSVYARNPGHPFTRKVQEALDEGILVLFAAGNCGAACPDGRCGGDTGPGRSIWGANGHPRVMTVGAVNRLEQLIGYSSQGPAALDSDKPDFCSISHFTGFFNSDSGTSAATPVAAGVVALLKQAHPAATQEAIKRELKATAKDIGAGGFDQHSGSGILQAKAAYDRLVPAEKPCDPYRERALRYREVYEETGDRRYLCHFYRYSSAFYGCLYRETRDPRYRCLAFGYRGAFYCCWYQLTRQRRFLCLCYRFRALYYCCRNQLNPNPDHRDLCRKLTEAFQRCQ